YVIARSDIVVNCDDPMVECGSLHHILSSRHPGKITPKS
ncbi:MAG TPA: proline racemase, partial [Marinobacter adhaerens]|nr:proline racemase [Marinobacter adhaerens]